MTNYLFMQILDKNLITIWTTITILYNGKENRHAITHLLTEVKYRAVPLSLKTPCCAFRRNPDEIIRAPVIDFHTSHRARRSGANYAEYIYIYIRTRV